MPKKYWTKENCRKEALKYQSRTAFKRGSGSAYQTASVNGWLNDVCAHLPKTSKPRGYWTKARCHKEALKYKSRGEFQMQSHPPYAAAKVKGWLDEICSHMEFVKRPRGFWTKERCKKEALKFKTISDFRENSEVSYRVAKKNGWLDELCAHMKPRERKLVWTKEKCREVALKCKTLAEFYTKHQGAYNASRKRGWQKEFFPKKKQA